MFPARTATSFDKLRMRMNRMRMKAS